MNSLKKYTIKNWLNEAVNKLEDIKSINKLNISNTRLDAEILLLDVIKKSKVFLYTDSDYILTNLELKKLDLLLKRRLKGEPIAYIIGHKEFWSLDLKVTSDVLIPRPDTELLVEKVLESLPKDKNCKIADIGTGSGAIAIALAKERPNWQIHAVDLSEKSLKIARQNAVYNHINNTKFYCADLFTGFENIDFKFDAIVSNPPYIDINDEYITNINSIELQYEPKMALIAENMGMDIIEKLIKFAPRFLVNKGFLFIEHGYKQKEDIKNYLKDISLTFSSINFYQDLNKLDRIVCIKFSDVKYKL